MSVEMMVLNNHEEWLKNRSRIGGSDASAIVGMNPYKTNVELWEEKVGMAVSEDISEKPYVKYGIQSEMHLRGLFRLDFPEYEVEYIENNMFLNDEFPWGHASLDGWLTDKDGRKGILEIKTTEILNSMHKEKWNKRIPDNYYIQILHYLMITGFEFAVLKAQLKTVFDGVPYLQTKHYHIERKDVLDDIEYLAQEEKKFWKMVQTGQKPDLLLPDF